MRVPPDLPANKVNQLLQSCLPSMLRLSLDCVKEAEALEEAVKQVLDSGIRTADLRGTSSTTEVGDAIAETVTKIFKTKYINSIYSS